MYNSLQLREVFHLEFLRRLARALKLNSYALKGGVNLRFFFNSFRYSEDMDIDVKEIGVIPLSDIVMKILSSPSFGDILKPFGIETVEAPDISKSKQTEITQRFKIHLLTEAGEDLLTKVEFSRRGFSGKAAVQAVSPAVLRNYRLAPLLASHYDVNSALAQKITALAKISVIQARDVFDIYILSSQTEPGEWADFGINPLEIRQAYENIFLVDYEQFRDTVVSYLSPGDRCAYEKKEVFDEIKIRAGELISGTLQGKS